MIHKKLFIFYVYLYINSKIVHYCICVEFNVVQCFVYNMLFERQFFFFFFNVPPFSPSTYIISLCIFAMIYTWNYICIYMLLYCQNHESFQSFNIQVFSITHRESIYILLFYYTIDYFIQNTIYIPFIVAFIGKRPIH